jgi:hypothetical protein
MVGLQDDIAAASTIAAAGAAFGDVSFAMKGDAAFSPVPGFGVNFNFVNKHDSASVDQWSAFWSAELILTHFGRFCRNFENKKGEARSLALNERKNLVGGGFGDSGGGDFGNNIDAAAVFVEQDFAIGEGKESPIAADADVFAGQKFAAALADEDAASGNELAAKLFYAEAFADAVATVTYAALTFFMCHKPKIC